MNSKTLKILLSLFAVNSVSLYLYFSSHPDYFRHKAETENRHPLTEYRKPFPLSVSGSVTSQAKPWPILPSYLPWSLNPHVPFRSCEGYFGNGFTRRVDLLKSSPEILRKSSVLAAGGGGAGGWFRCFYSDTLRSSICEGGRVRMHPEKIKMSVGGEKLETVIGRGEDDELPEFEFGAFDLEAGSKLSAGKKLATKDFLDQYVPRGAVSRHTMRDLIDSIQLVGSSDFECVESYACTGLPFVTVMLNYIQDRFQKMKYLWVEEPTLLVTRFEYANLFHTVTDWYSAYVASRVTGLPNRPHLVFVDGHCMAPLEETWNAVFSSLRYAKNFSGPVCFRHAILSPLGYETALFKGLTENIGCHGASAHDLWQKPDDQKTARLSEFGEMIRAAFGFPVDRHIRKPVSVQNVLFVRREDYLAHPRHGGRVQSRLSNEEEVFDALKTWVSSHLECKVNLVNGIFAHMPMKEQVRAIQDASVIIGAHGAGLTHIVSATPKTVILEIISSEYRRLHFQLIAQWKGLEYHAIYLDGSYASPPVVIENLSSILKGLGSVGC